MDTEAIRPVGFQRHRAEIFLLNQAAGQFRADRVEFVCAVRSFADENALGIAGALDERVIIRIARDSARDSTHERVLEWPRRARARHGCRDYLGLARLHRRARRGHAPRAEGKVVGA